MRRQSARSKSGGILVNREGVREINESFNVDEQLLNDQLASINDAARRVNQATIRLLRTTQGVDVGERPEDWWKWWLEENERYQSRKSLVKYRRYENSKTPAIPIHSYTMSFLSCLTAGTPVQTSRGLVAIDEMQVGDLVVAQNVETGQLLLQPVLQTTVRPPAKTMKIVFSKETIQATLGHGWWVSGKGWMRTKELTPGMMLHTAHGNQEVLELELVSTPEKAYNLIVAGSHNYFVGQQRLLSYDNSPIVPSLHPVPGYGQCSPGHRTRTQ